MQNQGHGRITTLPDIRIYIYRILCTWAHTVGCKALGQWLCKGASPPTLLSSPTFIHHLPPKLHPLTVALQYPYFTILPVSCLPFIFFFFLHPTSSFPTTFKGPCAFVIPGLVPASKGRHFWAVLQREAGRSSPSCQKGWEV